MFYVVPVILAALPLLLALGTRGRGRLRPAVAVPFVVSAVALVVRPPGTRVEGGRADDGGAPRR